MDNSFIEKNKQALLEEMGNSLTNLESIINETISYEPKENIEKIYFLQNMFTASALNLGSLISLFNQYYTLITGEVNEKQKPIGFQSMHEKEEK